MTSHTCPRRAEDGTDRDDSPFAYAGSNRDTYTAGHGIVGQGRGCSYCGSMHPDDFLEALREGALLGPTDKNYKAYVAGYRNNGPNGGKFYYQHLSEEQRAEFIALLNDRKVAFDYPGHFTVLPYFIRTEAAS